MSEETNSEERSSQTLGKFWTAPNILTLCRLVLVVPVTYLIVVEGPRVWILGLVLVAVATDWFDGSIARWSHTVSEWGKVLDPLVDKIAAGSIVLALFYKGFFPTWFILLVLVRDLLIVLGGIRLGRRTGLVPPSLWSGKVAVSAIAVTFLAALLRADDVVMQACVWITSALLMWSYLKYLMRYFRLMAVQPAVARTPAEDPSNAS
jgi:CDP-diacylglycerol--glycerol-3-phosphate 3-phosphatidyltransferase